MPASIRLIFVLFLLSGLTQAAEPPYQSNWEPNRYKLICNPVDACRFDKTVHQKTARLLPKAVDGIRALKFGPPALWGHRVGEGTEDDHIEVYEKNGSFIAQAVAICSTNGSGKSLANSHINIGNEFTKYDSRDHLLYYFMAHELFHVISYEKKIFRPTCQRVPGWIFEGIATAVAHEATRNQYPGKFPEKIDDRVAENFSGIRRYDLPLPHRSLDAEGNENWSGDMDSYRTSSFWRHLAEAHYNGSYHFLNKWMDREDWHGDWVNWLEANVEIETGTGLGMIHSGFLADYAGWGDKGYPGTYYGRSRWLDETLGGCETLYLSREEAVDYIDVDLLPLAGKCVEVRVSALGPSGIAEGESAAVQIAAIIMSGGKANRDGLHLGLAFSNDKKNFHCAREVKQTRRKGLGRCVFIPDDGKIRLSGGAEDAKVWNVIAQEKGDKPELRHEPGARKGELVNVYTLSYTPISVASRHTRYGGKDPVTARFYFILDVAKLKMKGENKKGVVGSLLEGADPQTTLPKVNQQGSLVNSYSKPDMFQPGFSVPTGMALPPQAVGKLSYFFVSTTAENASSSNNGIVVTPAIEDASGDFVDHPLIIGETGTFPVSLTASIDGEPAIGLPTPPAKTPGTVTVEEFTDLIFRARFRGQLCRFKDIETDKNLRKTRPCRDPVPVSGDIVKAFAGTRLPGYQMVVERTPSTEMYRKANELGMAAWSTPESSDPGEPGEDSHGGSGSSGGNLPSCACTCEERSETLRRGEDIKARDAAGEEVNIGALMGLMRCESQCRPEYMMCVMDEREEQKAREEEDKAQARRELKNSGECDCSCENLKQMESQLESLIKEMLSDSPSAMNKMEKLGRCMSVCQSEMMHCAQSR